MSELQSARPPQRFEPDIQRFVESVAFRALVTATIIVNAVTLGLETSPTAVLRFGPLLDAVDSAALWLFTVEMALKLVAYRTRFFASSWNAFDLAIVAIAWIPASGPLSVLRALRIVRVLRLVSLVPDMRHVVGALLHALPGMGSVLAVLALVFYISAVIATNLYGGVYPAWFGSVGESMFTLFQIMTLESWAMGIVRPVMESFPSAWLFFVPFVIVTSFAVLNLFIALIVHAMHAVRDADTEKTCGNDERTMLMTEILSLNVEVRRLRRELEQRGANATVSSDDR
ncbi:MAG: ion transporter [Pseudomonadota bacterium]